MADINVGLSVLPGEQIAVELIKLLQIMVVGQAPEQSRILWSMYIEDVKAWREFWKPLLQVVK